MGNSGHCGVSWANPAPGDRLEELWPSLRGSGRTQLLAMPILGWQDLEDVGGWMLSTALRGAPALCPSCRGSSPAASKPRFPSALPDPLHGGDPEGLKAHFKVLESQVFPSWWLGWGVPSW